MFYIEDVYDIDCLINNSIKLDEEHALPSELKDGTLYILKSKETGFLSLYTCVENNLIKIYEMPDEKVLES